MLARFLELDAVGFETDAETMRCLFIHELQQAGAATFVEGGLG